MAAIALQRIEENTRMKKAYAIAAAIVSLSGVAHAQTNVTMYGIIDTAVEAYNHANAAGQSVVRMPSLAGGMFPSRFGFRGTEDLGGGLNAIFTLENGLQPDTGGLNQGGRLFGRQAWVGLSGQWGALTAGRSYNMLYLSTFDVDPFGPSTYGLGALDPFIPNARHDNSLSYKGSFNGVTLGATYSLGRDTSAAGGPSGTNCAGESAADKQACREVSAMLRYDAPAAKYGAVLAYDRLNGGANAANGLTSSNLSDARLHLAGYFNLDKWKFGAGWLHRKNEGSATQPTSNLAYIDAAYRITPLVTVDGQLARLDYKDSPNDSTQFLLRAMLDLSKRTTAYVAGGYIRNQGTAAVALSSGGSVGAGMSQTGVLTGIKHTF
jgi:predicted porin